MLPLGAVRETINLTRQNEVGKLVRVALRHPRDAFSSSAKIESEWRALGYLHAPDLERACREFDEFVEILEGCGAEVVFFPSASQLSLDSIYVRDASVVCKIGVILGNMGKAARAGEPDAQAAAFQDWGVPVLGRISDPGRLEGGDVAWLDQRTIVVGRGYRTNDAGIQQLRALLADSVDDFLEVPLPHWRGPGDVFHLMSILSPVSENLLLVYSPLLPVPFREQLLERGFGLVEVPDGEFETMGTNVLALGPGRCLMLEGNPRTRTSLERAGIEVVEYRGREISEAGCGGPTCLTRPIERR